MQTNDPSRYDDLADAAWRWVLDQVRWDDGPWVPVPGSVPGPDAPHDDPATPPGDRDGSHSGIGGLAHTLAEIRLDRTWSEQEQQLAHGIRERVRGAAETETDPSFFDGLSSHVGTLLALDDQAGADLALGRLAATAGPDGWPSPSAEPRMPAGSPFNDVTLGNGSVVLAGVWAARAESGQGAALAGLAADLVHAEAQETAAGLRFPFVSPRRRLEPDAPVREMPNWSHGTAGMAAALAVAGTTLARPDLVEAARLAAEHLVSIADTSDGGFRIATLVPHEPGGDRDLYSYGWCHGPTGTARLFTALHHAGVTEVAGAPPLEWHDRALHSVVVSGLPDRLRPGFWDNDGRCCGSAGVGDVTLDGWQRTGRGDWLAFALRV
ncbi:MAG: lanthionine synthetase, partial [Actinomycetota bacterium]|nr:lanthionine synthetase [Actinomycetota bacterium]